MYENAILIVLFVGLTQTAYNMKHTPDNTRSSRRITKPLKGILKKSRPVHREVPFYPAESVITVIATKDSEEVSFLLPTGRIAVANVPRFGFNPSKFATTDGKVVSVYSREFCVTLDLKTLDTGTEWAPYPLSKMMTTSQWDVILPESFMKQHDIIKN